MPPVVFTGVLVAAVPLWRRQKGETVGVGPAGSESPTRHEREAPRNESASCSATKAGGGVVRAERSDAGDTRRLSLVESKRGVGARRRTP